MQLFLQTRKKRRKVLVVDDEIINRELLETILSLNYDVETASDGQEALEALHKSQADGAQFSLILMDLLMPNMSGFRLLETCKEDEALRDIPIIVMTSEKSAEVRSIRMGAEDFISKPYRMPEVILARCERIIELSEDKRLIRSIEKDPITGLYIKVFFDAYIRRAVPDLKRSTDASAIRLTIAPDAQEGDMILKKLAELIDEYFPSSTSIACRADNNVFFLFCAHREDYADVFGRMREALVGYDACLTMGIYQNADRSEDPERWFEKAYSVCEKAPEGTVAFYGE